MTAPAKTSPAPLRWHHYAILAALLIAGGFLRWDRIGLRSMWPDEFWSSDYLATGRGDSVFNLPTGVLINPPPAEGIAGAPAWPHIWTGLNSVIHPPFYFFVLRAWMDIFGDSDIATRSLSAVLSLIGVLVLFDTLRRITSIGSALTAAAMMALAVAQIDQSQDARPYTLLALMGILCCRTLLQIEILGATRRRLIILTVILLLTALTHYFAAGALIGLGIYALLRLRGTDRKKTIAAFVLAVALAGVFWGPWAWKQRRHTGLQENWITDRGATSPGAWGRVIENTAIDLFGRSDRPVPLATGVIVFVLPIVYLRRNPSLLIWWLVTIGAMLPLAIFDSLHHSLLLAFPRYWFIASPAMYALLASPLPVRGPMRWSIVAALIAGVLIADVGRIQEGPPDKQPWRDMALTLDHRAAPDDALVFFPGDFWPSAAFWYLPIRHYTNSHRPILILTGPADAGALAQLSRFKQIWLVGDDPPSRAAWLLPDWKSAGNGFGFEGVGGALPLVPTSPEPSPPANPPPSP